MHSDDLLYTNKFVPVDQADVLKHSKDGEQAKHQFRRYYESLYGRPIYQDDKLLIAPTDAASTNQHVPQDVSNEKETDNTKKKRGKTTSATHASAAVPTDQGRKKTAIVCINSGDRDTAMYPDPAERFEQSIYFCQRRRPKGVSTFYGMLEQIRQRLQTSLCSSRRRYCPRTYSLPKSLKLGTRSR